MVCKHSMNNLVFSLLAATGDVSAKLTIDIWSMPRKWMLGSVIAQPTGKAVVP